MPNFTSKGNGLFFQVELTPEEKAERAEKRKQKELNERLYKLERELSEYIDLLKRLEDDGL